MLGSTATVLPFMSATDLIVLVDDDAVAAERLVDGADDDAGRVRVARPALVLADRPHVDLDVAARHRRQHVGAVVVEVHGDGDALVLEVAEVVGDEDRREARPGRAEDADGVVGLCGERRRGRRPRRE